MKFPIQFRQQRGPYDIGATFINFVGNAAVVTVGGVCLTVISDCALKSLGFEGARKAAVAIPASIAEIGAGGVMLGLGALIAIGVSVSRGIGR